jgi:hypothetical protein
MSRFTVVMLGCALAAGCASDYLYRPAENATATIRGQVAARYEVPSGHPEGDVRIASFGIAKITPSQGTPFRAMHVRMIVANNGPQTWTLDTRQQIADVHGAGQVHAAIVQSDVGGLPNETIAAGQSRTLDLFFPLPAGVDRPGKLPQFDVLWRIDVAGQQVAERTPFERLQIVPMYASSVWGPPYAFGPFGWYDPFWGPGYIGAPSWYW